MSVPQDVASAAARRAWIVGIVMGLLMVVVSAPLGMCGSGCCLMKFASAAPPLLFSTVAGFVAAWLADWAAVPSESAVGFGAGLGARAGFAASLLGAGLGWLAMITLSFLYYALNSAAIAADQGGEAFVTALVIMVPAFLMEHIFSLFLAVGGGVVGILLATGGGAVAALVKAPKG